MTTNVEERYTKRMKADRAAESEKHRLSYVYFLERLKDIFRGSEAEQEQRSGEMHEVARLCRRERALHLGVSEAEAEADAVHGTVIQLASDVTRTEDWKPVGVDTTDCWAAPCGGVMCAEFNPRGCNGSEVVPES